MTEAIQAKTETSEDSDTQKTLRLITTAREKIDKACQQSKDYESTEVLRELLKILDKRKFVLDCGHRVTFGYFLGNDVVIRNGKKLGIICSQCSY